MKFSDNGIIISNKKYGEKSSIVKIFSKNHGVYRGFIKFANSKKNNAIFQLGNSISFDYVARIEDSLGSFINFDLCENNSAKFVFDKLRTNCAKSIISIIDDYFLERESFDFLYNDFEKFLSDLGNSNIENSKIIANFIKLELLILESLGYGIDLSSCVVTNSKTNLAYVSPKSAHAVSIEAGEKYANKLLKLPFFLVEEGNQVLQDNHLIDGLKLSGYFLKKFLFLVDDNKKAQQSSIFRDNIIKSVEIKLGN